MSDEDALLSAIAANPAEDTPRLVYADWLDEHDQHIRAEFIRLQIEISQKELLPRVLQNRYVDVWKRNQELIDNHRDELLGSLRDLPPEVTIEFRRGFVSRLEFKVGTFLDHAELVAGLKPLPRVCVTHFLARHRSFFINPHIGCVAELSCYSPEVGERDPECRVGGSDGNAMLLHMYSARLKRLEVLDLEGCGFYDQQFQFAWYLSGLPVCDIDLSNNSITDAGVVRLLGDTLPTRLRRLILGGNPIGDEGAIALAERWPTGDDDKLKELNLRFTNIGVTGQQALLARFGGRVVLF